MSQILVKFDNSLEQSDIIIPLVSQSIDETDEYYQDNSEIQQTKVYGIKVPLIEINNIVIDFNDIIDFSLKSSSVIPTLSVTVKDKYGLISTLDTPGLDNEVRVQILPVYDNIYKKINLTFFVKNIRIKQDFISLTGTYKLPNLLSSQFKSFGEINTYKLFETIAKESKLGFATNISENDNDKRYVYCDYKSYLDVLDREVGYGGTQNEIYDYWVDFWNNINLVNIYERYETIDSDDDLMIWVSGDNLTVSEGYINEPFQTVADINNHPIYKNSELCVTDYNIVNNTGLHINNGTDKVYSIYLDNKFEYLDHLIQNGDVKNDIFFNHEYLGENIGEHNYLLQSKLRDTFIQKINTESIEVTMKYPLLGLMRGGKVNFTWYYNDSLYDARESVLLENNIISEQNTTISYDNMYEEDQNTSNGEFIVDKSISGQYLITSCCIEYYDNNWHYKLKLNRPKKYKPNFLNNE